MYYISECVCEKNIWNKIEKILFLHGFNHYLSHSATNNLQNRLIFSQVQICFSSR